MRIKLVVHTGMGKLLFQFVAPWLSSISYEFVISNDIKP